MFPTHTNPTASRDHSTQELDARWLTDNGTPGSDLEYEDTLLHITVDPMTNGVGITIQLHEHVSITLALDDLMLAISESIRADRG